MATIGSFLGRLANHLLVDDGDNIRFGKARLIFSGAEKAEYALNLSPFSGVSNLYRSANIGGLVGVSNGCVTEGLNYGTVLAAVDRLDGGINVSPVLGIVSDFRRGYNFGGVALCHDDVREDAFHGGVVAIARTVRGKMRGVFTYCDDNQGEVIGLVNVVGRNGLASNDNRDTNGKRKKGKTYGLVNIDLSRPFFEGGMEFGWS